MVLSASRPKHFEQKLQAMEPDQLLDLAASNRRKFDTALVGTVSQSVAAIPSHGASLIGTAYSGPAVVYYWHKNRTIKRTLKLRELDLPGRGPKDIIVPTVVGATTLALGSGADGLSHLHGASGAASSSTHHAALGVTEWLKQASDSAIEAAGYHLGAVGDPSRAADLAYTDYSTAYNGDIVEHVENGAERLDQGADILLPGGEHLLTVDSAQWVGSGVTAAAIGKLTGKGFEVVLPKASGGSVEGTVSD